MTEPAKIGRPSSYTPELGAEICRRLADGESLLAICKTEGMPARGTVCRWLFDKDKADFQDNYARARETQAELLAEEIVAIADEYQRDTYTDANGVERTDQEVIGRSKLRVDARKWVASKLLPKKYGDRVQQEVSGPNGGPVQTERTIRFVDADK